MEFSASILSKTIYFNFLKYMKILLSAFACEPNKGSEPGNGWNWSIGLAERGYDVYCFTRQCGEAEISKILLPDNLKFYYITLPLGLEKLYTSSSIGMYLYYVLWQWFAYKKAKQLHKTIKFTLAHHVTWGSTQMGSFMYKLGVPFIFGPAGGGQRAPEKFKKYFFHAWVSEERRELVSRLMLRFNPACKDMLINAQTVLVSNPDTAEMVKKVRKKPVITTLDAALPNNFFSDKAIGKKSIGGDLKLLWVGRFLPRKGLILLVDVMNQLKEYPNITLTVVGDGEMKDLFLKKVKEDKLENTIFWKGKVAYEEVKEYYSTHDAFIFTSLRDSCPAQLIEAMAYSLPVITINLHGQAIIVNEERGIKCDCPTPEETVKSLSNAILTFYNHTNLIEQKGKAAYEFAKEQTWEKKIDYIVGNFYPRE